MNAPNLAMLHVSLMNGGKSLRLIQPDEYRDFSYPLTEDQFSKLGVHSLLCRPLTDAVKQLARCEREHLPSLTIDESVRGILSHLGRCHPPSFVPFDHTTWIAILYANGITFPRVADAVAFINGLFYRLTPTSSFSNATKRLVAGCQLSHQLGSQLAHGPDKHLLDEPFESDVLLEAIDLLGELSWHLAPHKCLQLAVLRRRHRLTREACVNLFNRIKPHRAGNVLELMHRGYVHGRNIHELMGAIEFIDDLPFEDLLQILKKETDIVPLTATPPASEQVTTPVLHKQLRVADLFAGRANLEAVQVIMVYGVIRPQQREIPNLNDFQVSKDELLATILPYATALGINNRQIDNALQQICMAGSMGTSGKATNKTIRFFQTPMKSSMIGTGLSRLVSDLNQRIARSHS